jgi:hypothetical protein
MNNVYHEFALLLMLSAVVGAVAVRLRQPLLVAYVPPYWPDRRAPHSDSSTCLRKMR